MKGMVSMLRRKFENKLNEWLANKKILLVDGARQVGKTYIIEAFCKQKFVNFVEINLANNKEAIVALEHARNVKDFLFVISSFSKVSLIPGQTVIFIDEIQLAPQIDFRTLAKPLCQNGQFRFIFSGSLLGVSEFNTALEPMGFLYSETMYPLDFEEFLWANGVQDEVYDKVRECFYEKKEVPPFIHTQLLDYFYNYLLVGGMPEAVDSYIKNNDLKKINLIHRAIEQHYVADITKYAPLEKRPLIKMAYEVLPSEISSKSKRFTLSLIGNQHKLTKVDNDFFWLSEAGVAIPVYTVSEPKIPLLLSRNSRLLKLFASDVGMLTYRLMDTEVQRKISAHEKDIIYGAIFENAVAQELLTHNFKEIYYFSSKKQGEVDFLITYKGNVLPLEIKSGKDYQRHVALDNLLANEEYEIHEAYIFSNSNIKVVGNKVYYPIYMIGCLQRDCE
ncbi:MAG: DUF4143 domain-containing protein [Bacilli bacterium]|nr:DUF4143 domain-containing protein [Bacilli bacterium]